MRTAYSLAGPFVSLNGIAVLICDWPSESLPATGASVGFQIQRFVMPV